MMTCKLLQNMENLEKGARSSRNCLHRVQNLLLQKVCLQARRAQRVPNT